MSYEYSAATGRLEIPNPYRIDNLGVFIAGGVGVLAGLWLLVVYRQALATPTIGAVRGVVIGAVLFAVGLTNVGLGLRQLRYFFGRGRPLDLTKTPGFEPRAIADSLREGALKYAEPVGALSSFLHKILTSLIFAPRAIRNAAEAQFANLLLTLTFLIGLSITSLLYSEPNVRAWTAVAFGLVIVFTLLIPFLRKRATNREANSSVWLIVAIVALTILLPPLLARAGSSLPNLLAFSFAQTILISLLILLVAQVFFFLALVRQLRPPPAINIACVQRSPSLNTNPSKLFEELERTLQSRWTETIPNRRYVTSPPADRFGQQSGSFRGDLIEETAPLPEVGLQSAAIAEIFSRPQTQWLTALTLLGTATYCAAVAAALRCGLVELTAPSWPGTALFAVVLGLTGQYCRLSAHKLWSRIDFQSLLLWFEIAGSYEIANIQVGNQLSTGMSSAKRVINVESMTLRVWAVEIDTVVFDRDGPRDWIGMRGRPDLASFYADHLEQFAARAATVVAPGGAADLERLRAIAQLQQQLSPSRSVPAALMPTAAPAREQVRSAQLAAEPPPPTRAIACPNRGCGANMQAGAAFCSACGTGLSL